MRLSHAFSTATDFSDSWGESAGAASVASHMIMNGGDPEGLFHAGFMQSGSVFPTGDITMGQADQDDILEQTDCLGAEDVLQCLRGVEFSVLKAAMDKSRPVTSYSVCCHDFCTLFRAERANK